MVTTVIAPTPSYGTGPTPGSATTHQHSRSHTLVAARQLHPGRHIQSLLNTGVGRDGLVPNLQM